MTYVCLFSVYQFIFFLPVKDSSLTYCNYNYYYVSIIAIITINVLYYEHLEEFDDGYACGSHVYVC